MLFLVNVDFSYQKCPRCTYVLSKVYSNKKVTSNFHGTVSINPVKMSQQKKKPKCLSNVGHTKIGNYLILSSYHGGL